MSRTPPPRHHPLWTTAAVAGTLFLAGCAAFNRGELVLARHVSFGQELIDLKRARDEGAISEQEYRLIKVKVMQLVDQIEIVEVVDDYTPDEASRPSAQPED